jgi:hypothetical protein
MDCVQKRKSQKCLKITEIRVEAYTVPWKIAISATLTHISLPPKSEIPSLNFR